MTSEAENFTAPRYESVSHRLEELRGICLDRFHNLHFTVNKGCKGCIDIHDAGLDLNLNTP